jgi:hypothetical protein
MCELSLFPGNEPSPPARDRRFDVEEFRDLKLRFAQDEVLSNRFDDYGQFWLVPSSGC